MKPHIYDYCMQSEVNIYEQRFICHLTKRRTDMRAQVRGWGGAFLPSLRGRIRSMTRSSKHGSTDTKRASSTSKGPASGLATSLIKVRSPVTWSRNSSRRILSSGESFLKRTTQSCVEKRNWGEGKVPFGKEHIRKRDWGERTYQEKKFEGKRHRRKEFEGN